MALLSHSTPPIYNTGLCYKPVMRPPDLSRWSGTGLLSVKTKHGEAGFSVYSPIIWNKLSKYMGSAITFSYLKSGLKKFFVFCTFP